jgi:hypothetical protein
MTRWDKIQCMDIKEFAQWLYDCPIGTHGDCYNCDLFRKDYCDKHHDCIKNIINYLDEEE